MTQPTILPFTIYLGEPEDSISDVVYEFMTNALDASPTADDLPELVVVGDCLVIRDKGPGITPNHLRTFGPTGARDPNKHGSHGLGLKDAIACCMRLAIPISIETVGRTLTFPRQTDSSFVYVQETPNVRRVGTQITIPVSNAKQVYAQAKERFLFLMDPMPTLLTSRNPLVEMYKIPEGCPGAIMMKGVRKIHSTPALNCIYNFVKPTAHQKNSISRNHTLVKGSFKKYFRSNIAMANPRQEFGVPILHTNAPTAGQNLPPAATPTPPPAPAAPAAPRTVQGDLARDLDAHCMVQDYHVWTLASADRVATRNVAVNIVAFLRTIPDVSVAATIEQGSLAKNTFVPLSSDIDIVVEINGFHGHESLISEKLKQLLRDNGCRMEDSGDRILNFTFQGVDFDLVLIDAAKEDARSKRIHEHGVRTADIVAADSNDRLKLQSFIRAVKYWSKRQGIAIKSCSLEMAVLALWSQLIDANTAHPFRHFLDGVTVELSEPDIKDYYELTDASIEEVTKKALATLALLG